MKTTGIGVFSVLSLVAILLLSTAAVASAADFDWMKKSDGPADVDSGVSFYATLKGGGFFPDKIDGLSMNIGTGAEIGIGVKPVRFMAAEFTAGYLETDDNDSNIDNYHFKLSAVPVMLSVKAIAPLQYVEPYLVGGIGFQYVTVKFENSNAGRTTALRNGDLYSAFQYGAGMRLLDRFGIEVRKVGAYTGFADHKAYSGLQLYGSVDISF